MLKGFRRKAKNIKGSLTANSLVRKTIAPSGTDRVRLLAVAFTLPFCAIGGGCLAPHAMNWLIRRSMRHGKDGIQTMAAARANEDWKQVPAHSFNAFV